MLTLPYENVLGKEKAGPRGPPAKQMMWKIEGSHGAQEPSFLTRNQEMMRIVDRTVRNVYRHPEALGDVGDKQVNAF